MSKRTCYYCGAPATSAEHVPPKCIFPEQKDAFGKNYRKNLITVPSCDVHNTEKSKEDEFLLACLTPSICNNGTGFVQTKTKLRRAIENTKGRLQKEAMFDGKNVTWIGPGGTEFPCWVGGTDFLRLSNALEHVARGLFFYATRKRFVGDCSILPSSNFIKFPKDPDLTARQLIVQRMTAKNIRTWETYGDNPEVFRFYLEPVDPYGMRVMKMVFFRGTEVFAAFRPEGTVLPDDKRVSYEVTVPFAARSWEPFYGEDRA